MGDDDLREEEKRSLLNDISKKGISKTIKAMPLKIKIIIIVSAVIVILLLIFIVLVSTLIPFFFSDDSSSGTGYGNFSYIMVNYILKEEYHHV